MKSRLQLQIVSAAQDRQIASQKAASPKEELQVLLRIGFAVVGAVAALRWRAAPRAEFPARSRFV